MQVKELCVLIPSLSPDERLPEYVDQLLAAEFGGISADHGMIAMAKMDGDKIASLTVCDPTQRRTDISFSVGGEKFHIETDRARGKAYDFNF